MAEWLINAAFIAVYTVAFVVIGYAGYVSHKAMREYLSLARKIRDDLDGWPK